jgi:hypothetical protein
MKSLRDCPNCSMLVGKEVAICPNCGWHFDDAPEERAEAQPAAALRSLKRKPTTRCRLAPVGIRFVFLTRASPSTNHLYADRSHRPPNRRPGGSSCMHALAEEEIKAVERRSAKAGKRGTGWTAS